MKLIIDSNPIPTPVSSFDSVCEIVLDIEICIKVCPTFPKIKINAMTKAETPMKVDNNEKARNMNTEAIKRVQNCPEYQLPFLPFFP